MSYVGLVDAIWNRRDQLYIPNKADRLAIFYPAFLEVIEKVDKGKTYTPEEAADTDYWRYISGYHASWSEDPLSRRAYKQLRSKFFDGIKLYEDIKKRGIKDPLEFRDYKVRLALYAGYRRLVIAHVLRIPIVRYIIVENH